jgi:hypothetical protein
MAKNVEASGAGMTKTVMPEVGGDGKASVWRGGCNGDGVKVASTIAVNHHASGRDILNRKTKSVKFDRTIVVPSELTN